MIFKIYNFICFKLEYYLLTILNCIIPKNKMKIFIFDKKFKKDNVWTLANYLARHNEYNEYKIYYYTEEPKMNYSNIKFISNPFYALWVQLTSKYIFYSYRGDGIKLFKFKKNQVILDTMHGSPLKNIGYLSGNSRFKNLWKYENSFSNILCLSDFFKVIVKKSFGAKEKQCITLGYPRNDIIFQENIVLHKLNIVKEDFSKVVLWLPTWRNSIYDKNNKSNIEYPILNVRNIQFMNDFLYNAKILILIKPHPYQSNLDIFNENYSNIKIIKDEYLNTKEIELYQMFNEIDALLTDYSSVYFDFLLTMKPIGFTVDDFESYRQKQGFVVDNPLEIMPGEKITNIKELIDFLNDIKEGNDRFYYEREKINNLANKYQDGNSTKRIIEHLGI